MEKLHALHRRYTALRETRKMWDSAYRTLAEHFCPTRWRSDDDTDSYKKPVLNNGLVDSTGILDMRTLAAGMQGGMTSPVRPWFKLEFQDDDMGASHDARVWLEDVTTRMQTALHNSNFYNSIHTLYGDIGTFGTGCMMETATPTGLLFQVARAGEYCVDIAADGTVDVLFIRSHMTARQIVQEYGEDKCPTIVQQCAKAGRDYRAADTQRFDVLQAILPKADYDTSGRWPVASVHYMYDGGNGGKPWPLRESGFESFPAFIPRWSVSGADVYGTSPGMDVLADCMMLQQMGKTMLKAIHKAVDPPMSVNAGLKGIGLDLRPGGQNFVDWTGQQQPVAAVPIAQPDPQSISVSMEARQDVRNNISQGLYADLFRMLITNDRRQITAREIEGKEAEKLILVGPVVERLHKELFSPLIARTFELMRQWDYLPLAPQGIDGANIKVEFVSVLAQAQRMVSTSGIDQTLAFAAQAGQMMPEVLDSLDPDKVMDVYTESLGVNRAILRGEDEIKAIREQRAAAQAQAQQQQQMAQAVDGMQGMANAAKSMGQTPVGADGETAISALLGGVGGM